MKKYAVFAYIFFILIHPGLTHAQEAAERAEGSAQKSVENTDVKKEALDEALRKAVEAALGSLVKKEAIAISPVEGESIEREIYSNPRNFILNYRIVSEGWITHMDAPAAPGPSGQAMPNQAGVERYHVWIEANIDSAQLRGLVGRITGGDATSFFRIVIIGVTDYGSFRSLLASLEGIAVINDISYDSFYRGDIALTAKINGNGQGLPERIAREVAGRFIVAAEGPRTVIIRAVAPPATPGSGQTER